jgi:hypothetical protein
LLGRSLGETSFGIYAPEGEHADVSCAGYSQLVLIPPKDMLLGNFGRLIGLALVEALAARAEAMGATFFYETDGTLAADGRRRQCRGPRGAGARRRARAWRRR